MLIYANNSGKRHVLLIDAVGCVKTYGIRKFLVRCTTSGMNPHHVTQPTKVIDIHVVEKGPVGVLQPLEHLKDGSSITIPKPHTSSIFFSQ